MGAARDWIENARRHCTAEEGIDLPRSGRWPRCVCAIGADLHLRVAERLEPVLRHQRVRNVDNPRSQDMELIWSGFVSRINDVAHLRIEGSIKNGGNRP
jgi:hypothetical protein